MPKTRSFRLVVAGSPEDVRARLAARTHLRPFPSVGRAFARASLPLAGHVAQDGSFRVASSGRDFFRRLRPVATGRVVETGAGTAIEGEAGLPAWVTWYLRVVWIALVAGAIGTAGMWAAGIAGAGAVALALLAGVVFAAVSIGLHVGHADGHVDELVATLEREFARDATDAEPVAEEQPRVAPRRPTTEG